MLIFYNVKKISMIHTLVYVLSKLHTKYVNLLEWLKNVCFNLFSRNAILEEKLSVKWRYSNKSKYMDTPLWLLHFKYSYVKK